MIRIFAFTAFLLLAPTAQAAPPTPEGAPGQQYREQVYRVVHTLDEGRRLAVYLYRPPGEEPRRLVVFAHHTSGDAARNREPRHGIYPGMVRWFVDRGYAVAVVQRRGYGLTGGEQAMGFSCARPNHAAGGRTDAADMAVAIDSLIELPFIQKTGVVAIGQSTGGWSVMALAAENHPAVSAIINFGGGRRGISGQTREACAMDELTRDARSFGARARTPSLWLYSENDRSFPPAVSRPMAEAYRAAGGRVDFQLVGPFGDDGHALLPNPRGAEIWGPIVERFLAANRGS